MPSTVPTFAQVRRLENLAASLKMASNRKRKAFTLHPDEFPALIEALSLAATLADKARIAAINAADGFATGTTTAELIAQYADWHQRERPQHPHCCADDLRAMAFCELTDQQTAWINDFCGKWDIAQAAEDKAR